MIKTYRKKVLTQAEQFDGSDEMIRKYDIYGSSFDISGETKIIYVLDVLESSTELSIGDWIATGINGEHGVIRDNVFKKTYEEVEDNE